MSIISYADLKYRRAAQPIPTTDAISAKTKVEGSGTLIRVDIVT